MNMRREGSIVIDVLEAEAEVRRLHRFFEAWFNGREGFSIDEFTDVLDDRFTIVSPSGTTSGREDIVAAVAGAFGSTGVAIAVEDVRAFALEDSVICRYIEVQRRDTGTTRRISTAIFRSDADGRPVWVTVHETWTES